MTAKGPIKPPAWRVEVGDGLILLYFGKYVGRERPLYGGRFSPKAALVEARRIARRLKLPLVVR